MTPLLGAADPALSTVALTLGGLFLLSFFFSGTETAFFSLQEIDRRRLAEEDTPTARRAHGLLSRRTSLITTILMGNETVNVTISTTAAALVAAAFPDKPWLTIVAVTPVIVLLSEITPKVVAFRYAPRWVRLAVWPLEAVRLVLFLPRLVVDGIVTLLSRLFGVTPGHRREGLAEADFLVLVERGTAQGVVGADERDIIEAVFELDDLPVSRLMTPRPDMFTLPLDTPWDSLLAQCRDMRFSRVPIWEDDPENIVGVLLVKDLLRFRRRPPGSPRLLRELLLEPVFVPATKAANDMMKEMIRRRIHMAFVVDEHGTVIGLLSLDDLIMELVGELADDEETDDTDEISGDPSRGWTVRASMDLEDLADQTGISLPEGDVHTLGGWVVHALGRIPDVGDEVEACGHRFEVVEMEGRRVTTVAVAPLTPGDAVEVSS